MTAIAFYCMNEKGFTVLDDFIRHFGASAVACVVAAEDANVEMDYYREIRELAEVSAITFYDRSPEVETVLAGFEGYRFAIGWRWMIAETEKLVIFHDSLLPKYRGFAPLVNSLVNNEEHMGVTALFASEHYDAGDIIAQASSRIEYPVSIAEAIRDIAQLYCQLVNGIYADIKAGNDIVGHAQDEADASYSCWLDEQDYRIDWQQDADRIRRFVDAVGSPYAGASCVVRNEEMRILAVAATEDLDIEDRSRHVGKVITFDDGRPVVICGHGLLVLHDVRNSAGESADISMRTRFC